MGPTRRVGSCGTLDCPSAQELFTGFCEELGGISGITLGFYNSECLGLCVASKTKSLGVKGMGNVSIVMLGKLVNSGIGHGVVSNCLR